MSSKMPAKGRKEIQYFEILKNAFLITWENKFLWVFGFLIFLGSGFGNLGTKNETASADQEKQAQLILDFAQKHLILTLSLLVLFVLLVVGLILLRIVATSALIKTANSLKVYSQLKVSAILLEAKQKYLKKLFLLELMVAITLGLLLATMAIPVAYLFFLKAKTLMIVMLLAAIVIVLPLVVLACYLLKYAYFYVVLGDFEIRVALESAYVMFAKNIKESLIMGVITVATSSFLLTVLSSIFSIAEKISTATTFLMAIVFVATLSWLEAFLQTAWLLFFQQIAFVKDKEEKVAEKALAKGDVPSPETV